MTEVAQQPGAEAAAPRAEPPIRRLQLTRVHDNELTELRERIYTTRWPERETVADASQGVQLATVQALAKYWVNEYDWRRCEAKLAALPHFVTEIDGLDIHFIHVRSRHDDAMPIILTHGWPGSIIEFLKVIEPLTAPTVSGGRASDAFDVVIPSMPGYGFSGKPTATGWGPARIAAAWITLMRRLGYTRFAAQGGDWGSMITDLIGVAAPPELVGIHTNMSAVAPADLDKAALAGLPPPAGLSDEERAAYERLAFTYQNVAYGAQMGSRPQSIAAIGDSPVGLATYLLDHDPRSYDLIARAFAGQPGGLTRDDVLDNITLYWLTNTAISAARLYWENKLSYFAGKGVAVPAAVTEFPDEIVLCPRSWAERAYKNLVYYHQADRGGHFAAWEQPAVFADELRAAFRSLR